MAEIVLRNSWALLALPLAWLLMLALAWRRRFRPFGPFLLRLALIVLVTGGLAHPVYLPPAPSVAAPAGPTVLLVDQSASQGQAGQRALAAEGARLARQLPEASLLFFADRALVLPPALAESGRADLPLNPEVTDLAQALTTGTKLLRGQPGRLLLLSDGQPTTGDTPLALAQLAAQNIPVDVLPPDPALAPGPDVSLARLEVLPLLRQGETLNIEVEIHSQAATQAVLKLSQPSRQVVLAEDTVSLEPGLNSFTFAYQAEQLGLQTFRAILSVEGDPQPANNSLSAFSRVYPPPQVLLVGEDEAEMERLGQQLEQAGFVPDRMAPANIPTRLSSLEPYAGLVLLDVSARHLELEQMIALEQFVHSLGRGLLVLGGRSSFSLGGYEDTPLADLLPFSLEPPPREERPPVALLLIIDHSGSMIEGPQDATKLAMAKAAAIRATEILGPSDLIGILMFDNRYAWVVPFQPVSTGADLLQIQQAIAGIPAGGGTRILQALEVGLPALAQQQVAGGARHAVLFSDGKSFDGGAGVSAYYRVIDFATEANITLSTIAIGRSADQILLTDLAERGRGRYHLATTPEELPALTIAESDILRSEAIQEGTFRPAAAGPHPLLAGLSQGDNGPALPELSGYIAMTPRPRAEIVLQVGPGDPLLGVWGYGLGRVAAWASDTGKEWTAPWPDASRFWGRVLGYTLPDPGLGLLQLTTGLESDRVVTLTADGLTATGQSVDLAPTQATLTPPTGQEIPLTLRQVEPGRYRQRLRLATPGAYRLSVSQARPDGPDQVASTGFVLPYPAEYAPAGDSPLPQIAATTGGRLLSPDQVGAGSDSPPPAAHRATVELWPWLLLAALILWPVEIAWRRWSRLRIQ